MSELSPTGKWFVRYEDGKPIQSGFCRLDGADIRRYTDMDDGIQAQVEAHIKEQRDKRLTLRGAALAKLKTVAALTDAEIKALFGGG